MTGLLVVDGVEFNSRSQPGYGTRLADAAFEADKNFIDSTWLEDKFNAGAMWAMNKNARIDLAANYARPVVIGLPTILSGVRYDMDQDRSRRFFVNEDFFGLIEIKTQHRSGVCSKDTRPEWQRYLFDPTAPYDAETLAKTTVSLVKELALKGPRSISLQGLGVSKVSGMHLAVILRATASNRKDILGWKMALEIARAALNRDSINPAYALIGLKW